jgi:hypothetical protein
MEQTLCAAAINECTKGVDLPSCNVTGLHAAIPNSENHDVLVQDGPSDATVPDHVHVVETENPGPIRGL